MQCHSCDTEFAPNIELEYQYCPCCGSGVRDRDPLEIVWKSGLCGFRNRAGAMVTPFKYDNSFYQFHYGFTSIILKGKKSLLDELGHEVFPFYYDNIEYFKEGLCKVSLGAAWGMIDLKGNVVIPIIYQDIYAFSDDLAVVCLGYKYGFIDRGGTLVIPCIYEHAFAFSEGLAAVQLSGKFGYIDQKGDTVIPFDYAHTICFYKGLATVKVGEKYGCIDRHNNEVIPIVYNYFLRLRNDIIDVRYVKWRGFLNLKGEVVEVPKSIIDIIREDNTVIDDIFVDKFLDFKKQHADFLRRTSYTVFEKFPNELLGVSKDNKVGIIDYDCNIVIPVMYDYLDYSYGSYISAQKGGKFGAIDKQNNVIIPFEYDSIFDTYNQGFRVLKDGLFGCIDTNNQAFIPLMYDSVEFFDECNLVQVTYQGKIGFVNRKNEVIIPFIYDEAENEQFEFGVLWMQRNNSWFLIDRLGREICEDEHFTVEAEEYDDDYDDYYEVGDSLRDL